MPKTANKYASWQCSRPHNHRPKHILPSPRARIKDDRMNISEMWHNDATNTGPRDACVPSSESMKHDDSICLTNVAFGQSTRGTGTLRPMRSKRRPVVPRQVFSFLPPAPFAEDDYDTSLNESVSTIRLGDCSEKKLGLPDSPRGVDDEMDDLY